MKKALFIIILFCMVGSSTIHISTVQTVDDSFNPKTSFTNGETIWLEIIIINDEEVSYPQVKVSYFYMRYLDYPYYHYATTTKCEGIVIEDGMNPGEEKTVYLPCTARNDSAQGQHNIRAYLYAYQNGWKQKDWKYSNNWDFNPDQPWTGAYVKSITVKPTNNQNNKFLPNYIFNSNITVHNFNPTYDLVANLTFNTAGQYTNCDNIGEVTLPANSDSLFETQCTTKENYKYNYIGPYLHFGQSPIWGDTVISHKNQIVYVDVGECPDGVRQPANGEQCDTNDLGGHTCQSLGYESGNLACNSPPQTNCRFDVSECIPKPVLRVRTQYIQTDMVSYLPYENVSIFAQIRNNGNVNLPTGSYLRVKFEDLNTNQVLFSEDTLVEDLQPNAVFGDWVSFENGEFPLYYFRVSATTYTAEGTYIQSLGSNIYSPATAGELTCTNTTEGGLVYLVCTGTGMGRQLLKAPKNGGTFIPPLTTSPTKALYFWESGDNILIIDNPENTEYHITLAYAVEAAPGLSPILAVIVMVLLSAFVWEKYVK